MTHEFVAFSSHKMLNVSLGETEQNLWLYANRPRKCENYSDGTFMDGTVSLPRPRTSHNHAHNSFSISILTGFIVVASCVMTFEARDSAAKVVPARFKLSGSRGRTAAPGSRRTTSKQIFRKKQTFSTSF